MTVADPTPDHHPAGQPGHWHDPTTDGPGDENSVDHHRRRYSSRLVAVLVTLVLGGSFLTPFGRHQWAISLIRQPEHDTALYFTRAATLPRTFSKKPLIISFTVLNNEGHAVNYHYTVSSSDGVTSSILAESSDTVASAATWKVSVAVEPTCKLSPCRITVALPGHPETIDLLVDLQQK